MTDEGMDMRSELPKRSLWQKIVDVALMDVNTIVEGGIDAAAIERLERVLLEADFGVDATMALVDELERAAERGRIRSERELKSFLGERIRALLVAGDGASGSEGAAGSTGAASSAGATDAAGAAARGRASPRGRNALPSLRAAPEGEGPSVVLLVGVNGTGKTTTAAKLAWRLRAAGERALLAATDTFRAGAQEQLRRWAERVGADFVGGQPGGDPAAVAFDAVEAAMARDAAWLIVDTAGRLHTQQDLMEELRKIDRVLGRKVDGAPHERLLVVDATSGQNVIAQAERFGSALELSGLVLAKFDSTARAGTAVAVARELAIPVRFLGTGEEVEDLEPFDPDVYVEKVLGVA